MRRLLCTTALALSGGFFMPGAAHADCTVFDQSGSGASLSGTARCVIFEPGQGEQLRVADQPGSAGAATVTDGATVTLESGDPAVGDSAPFFTVGRRPGAVGTATISGAGSTITLEADNNGASAQIGREGIGTVNVQSGGTLSITDTTAESGSFASHSDIISVGLAGGTGTLNVTDGSTVSVDSASGALLAVGRSSGSGTVTVEDGSTISLRDRDTAAGSNANLTLGRDRDVPDEVIDNTGGEGGTGRMSVTDSDVSIVSDNGFAGIFVGREEDTVGELDLSGGGTDVTVRSGTGDAGLTIGRDGGASGMVTVSDGAAVTLDGESSSVSIGREAGATGTLEISGGGTVTVDGPNGDVTVGAAFADFGRTAGGTGSLEITGAGSVLSASDNVVVGAPEDFGGGTGSGRLTVADGGQLIADQLFIGTGGTLDGNGGSILADLVLDGGTIAPGASPGVLDVAGDFTILGGLLDLEIGGEAPGAFDAINITGDFLAPNPFDVSLSFIDGYVPVAGASFDLLNVSGATADLAALFDGGLIGLDIAGLDDGQTLSFSLAGGTLTGTVGGVSAVPLPASAPFLLAGLGALALLRRRRRG